MSHGRRLENIASMALSFLERCPLTDLVRFTRACGYRSRTDQLELWNRIRRERGRYYAGRLGRCLKDGTGFGVKDGTYYRKEIDLSGLHQRLKSGRRIVIKEKKGETLSRVEDVLFVKKTSPVRARRIWKNAHGLAMRRIDTPRLWACGPGWVAGEWVESIDLYRFVRTSYGDLHRKGKDAFLERLARIVRRMHDHGIRHADLKAGNVLVGSERIVVVDLDRVRFSVDIGEKDRMFNLAQLNAAVPAPLTRSDRLRFLNAYFGRCRSLWKDYSRWVREIMRMTVKRAHRWPDR
jgi:tRNA A-37 threonylcarbamoyl transferase component Bud32